MHLRKNTSLFAVAALALLGLAAANGQTQDTSGNSLLNGKFQFRHVAVLNVDSNTDPAEIAASYGTITFDGAGKYTITGTTVDNTVSNGAAQPLSVTGTYAIGSNGAGYVANPLAPSDFNAYIYGAVAQGVYAGSSTESQLEGLTMNDIFVAIPVGPAPTNASFTSPYQTGLLDFAGAGPSAIKNALFELSPDGTGKFGGITLNGQASNQSAATLTQSITGATYNFNTDGSATLAIPLPASVSSANAMFTGSKTIFQSKDGNFILGWTATGFDIFFGVKALTIPGTNSLSGGLYFTTALEDFLGVFGTDSYYGSTRIFGDSAGNGILHQRLNVPSGLSFDYGFNEQQIVLNPDGTTGTSFFGYDYVFGDGGQAFVAIGSNGYYSLQVGLHAPSFSGSGVYLNPIGVVNAASYQPITASLAPGELITLFGTNLSPASPPPPIQGGQAFPTTLGGVSVTIDSLPCPIYYVSPTQLAVIVPYGVASNQTGLANIQVTNNNVQSNVVQMYLTDSAPGSFSQNLEGIGLGATLHAATGALVTTNNPAQPGEYISLYLTGLGTVTPAVSDGALGPTNPLSQSDLFGAGSLGVLFNDFGPNGSVGNAGNIQFAGLAPQLAGLYQINVQVPDSGLASGDNVYVEFATDAADVNQIQIPYGSASTNAVPATQSLATTSPISAVRVRASRLAAMRSQAGRPMAHRVARRGAPAPDAR
jgi:uncharacterized protein (TIGR03437 family)